jgi:hypothetical protein
MTLVKDSNAVDLDELVEHDLTEIGIKPLMDLVAQQSWWVSPKVFREVAVVYPLTRRNRGIHEKRGTIIGQIRLWYNEPANHAFWLALGENEHRFKNFFVCHIYEGSVWDPLHYTNLANLAALPRGLQSLTEWGPIRNLLKYHSYVSFGYAGPNGTEPLKPKYCPTNWRHQIDPSSDKLNEIIAKLKGQQKSRPQFRVQEQAVTA